MPLIETEVCPKGIVFDICFSEVKCWHNTKLFVVVFDLLDIEELRNKRINVISET
jgi:hypothetical protein